MKEKKDSSIRLGNKLDYRLREDQAVGNPVEIQWK
jgi:hypothetical protein